MTDREKLFEMVESIAEKLTSGEYRQLLEEIAKVPSGEVSQRSEVNRIITLDEFNALGEAYDIAIARSDQLVKTSFLLKVSQSQLFQMGVTDFLEDNECNILGKIETNHISKEKYRNGTIFWICVGSSEHLIVKNILRTLKYDMEFISVGGDKGIITTYPYSEMSKSWENDRKSIPIFLVENDIHFVGRRVCKNIATKQALDIWRLGTSFMFDKYDNGLFFLTKMLQHMNYEISAISFMGKEGNFFVKTTYPYERYMQDLDEYDSKLIPIEISERDLLTLGIKRQETVDGGTEFLLSAENSFDYYLLHFIMETLGYELDSGENLCYDLYPGKDIRGYTTSYPWYNYRELVEFYGDLA